jgi:diguanylate cyclase (GGDEF)-like protein
MAALCVLLAAVAAATSTALLFMWREHRESPAACGRAGVQSRLVQDRLDGNLAALDAANPVAANPIAVSPSPSISGIPVALTVAGSAISTSLPTTVAHAEAAIAQRTRTVDQLLEFSQTIQGAGKPEQVYPSLVHYLRTELELSGAALLTFNSDTLPAIQIKATWPEDMVAAGACDMDSLLCPCLRQNQPRCFKPDAAPVRCAIDQFLKFPPAHPAFCIPFTIGRQTQAIIHMLLPPGSEWTDPRKQLAQAYVTAAHAALTSLHLLAEAEKQSMTDGLTGLFNRRSMENLLQREVALTERHGQALSMVMIDLDHFKEINDAHGHAAGDHMLRSFADCVRITLRKTDLAFRYGGDEFVIVLPQTPIAQAQQVVQKLRQAFSTVDFSHAIAHLDHNPTLSIGVAERSKAGNVLTLPALLSAADQALYNAKAANRNCVKVYEPPVAA